LGVRFRSATKEIILSLRPNRRARLLYQETGILEIDWNEKGKDKQVWNDLPNQWDKPVKAINQLYARLCEIFPKLERHRHTEAQLEGQVMGSAYYLGLCKRTAEKSNKVASESSECCSTVKSSSEHPQKVTLSEDASEDASEATMLTQIASEDSEDENPTILKLCNEIAKLSTSDKQKLTELLTGVPCSDPLKAFRVGDTVAGNRSEDASYNWHGRIVEIHTSINCKVDWQEREGMKGGRVISMLFCDLRKI